MIRVSLPCLAAVGFLACTSTNHLCVRAHDGKLIQDYVVDSPIHIEQDVLSWKDVNGRGSWYRLEGGTSAHLEVGSCEAPSVFVVLFTAVIAFGSLGVLLLAMFALISCSVDVGWMHRHPRDYPDAQFDPPWWAVKSIRCYQQAERDMYIRNDWFDDRVTPTVLYWLLPLLVLFDVVSWPIQKSIQRYRIARRVSQVLKDGVTP